jgi:HEAT repeat protein
MTREEALAAALSTSWSDRAAAATELARQLDAEVEPTLHLLLTDQDAAVVEAAAAGLLERGDQYGIGLFCLVHREADDQVGDHLNDVLRDAVNATPEIVALLRTAAEQDQPGAVDVLGWLRM